MTDQIQTIYLKITRDGREETVALTVPAIFRKNDSGVTHVKVVGFSEPRSLPHSYAIEELKGESCCN